MASGNEEYYHHKCPGIHHDTCRPGFHDQELCAVLSGISAVQAVAGCLPYVHAWRVLDTLFIFGSVLERVWGTKKYLLFYFVTGLGAAALHTGVQWIEVQHYMSQIAAGDPAAAQNIGDLMRIPTVGASGAIYGLLLGYGMLYPDAVLALIFPPIALKAKWFVIIFAVIELLTGLTGTGGGVAHFAHLGGMLFGWLLILYWKRRNRLYQRYD